MELNSQSNQESKFRRFLPSGFKRKKEKQKASSAETVAADASAFDGSAASSPSPPADGPKGLQPSAPLGAIVPVAETQTAGKSSSTDQTEPVASAVESNDPPSEVDQEEILPTSQRVALAEKRLKKAGNKLEKIITQKDSAEFEIKASADINTLAENIGAALVSLMEHRKVAESKQSQARSFVVEWAKKTIPFVDTGLTIANNFIPPPYNLIASGLVWVLQKAEAMSDVSDKVDDTIENLLLAMQNVGVVEDFSNVHLEEVRIAAIYLSTSVMDCLAGLIEWVGAPISKKILMTPEFDQTLEFVHQRSSLYATALYTRTFREQQHADILEWIWEGKTKYITPQTAEKVGDTGHWFFQTSEYLDWVGQGPSTLICSGKAGAGKSHLVSVIFNRLLQTPHLGLVYFFFNDSDRTQTAENVVRVLLRQILQQLDSVPKAVMDEYSKYKRDPHKRLPDRKKFVRLLASSIEEFVESNKNRVFILVDAYDELLSPKEKAGAAALEKSELRSSLSVLNRTNCAKILITTRPHYCEELRETFPESRTAEIQGNPADMETYIRSEMKAFDFPGLLQEEILRGLLISNLEEKWFLLLSLQTKFVLDSSDPIEITWRLTHLPKDLEEAYNGVVERMTTGEAAFAYRILGWIFQARRVLTMSELQEALAVSVDVPSLRRHLITSASKIVSVCGGLLYHDKASDLVTFSHETVREFLRKSKVGMMPSHSEISRTCLTYLQLHPLVGEVQTQYVPQVPGLGRPPFYDLRFTNYAIPNWVQHALLSRRSIELETAILQTFASDERRLAFDVGGLGDWRQSRTLLQIIIENGLTFIFTEESSGEPFQSRLAQQLLVEDINKRGRNLTALHSAVLYGDIPALKWLLSKKAEMVVAHFTNYRVSSVPVSGTALHFAALSGNLEIAKLLVRGHWDVNKMNDDGETAFHVAAQRGELEIMKYLFEEGHVDVNLGTRENNSGSFETTALQYAARGGYLPVVKWLADNGADLDQVNVNGDSAFRIATSYKQFHVIMFLLERNAIVDSLDLETILHVAVDHGAVWVVKGVVEQQSRPANVSPAAKDHGMQEPVDRLGDVDVITWLFEQGNTDIEKAIYGRIALHMAVNNGLLLLINWVVEDQNVNINAHLDIYGTTPLHHVTRKGNVELVKWLVTQGHANVNAKDAFGQTALQLAIGMRHVELVKCLFENAKENLNVGPNASTGLWTPLHFAAFHGNLEVIRYLMKTGKVDVNAKTERHYTPAQIAAKRGHWDVVKELIEVWHARDVVKMVDIAWNPDYPDLTATVE